MLRSFRDEGRQFDVVILNPPSSPSATDRSIAARGYKDINWLAMRLLRPGGLLATFSCSGSDRPRPLPEDRFWGSVNAGRDAQIIAKLGQGADHPILLSFPEGEYLKGLLCRVD